jgi:hypothetical protein
LTVTTPPPLIDPLTEDLTAPADAAAGLVSAAVANVKNATAAHLKLFSNLLFITSCPLVWLSMMIAH